MENWKRYALAFWALASSMATGHIWNLHDRLNEQQAQMVELQQQLEQNKEFTEFMANMCTGQLFPTEPVK